MPHVLLVTSEMAGRVNAVCEVARRLVQAGDAVTVACVEDVRAKVAEAGAQFVRLVETEPRTGSAKAPRNENNDRSEKKSLGQRMANIKGRRRRLQAAVDRLNLPALQSQLSELDPDICIVDTELPVVVMAAVTSGTPTATFTTMLSVWKHSGLPPLHTAIVPGKGFTGTRVGIEFAWIGFRLRRRLAELKTWLTKEGVDRRAVLRSASYRIGFDFSETDRNQWLVPVVFTKLPMFSLNADQMEFPHKAAKNPRYIGPALNRARAETAQAVSRSTSDRLRAIYQRRREGDSSALIYCGFGAWDKGDDEAFIGRVIEAVAGNPKWEMVLGLGNRRLSASLLHGGSNVHVFDWAPQLEVLHHADLALHHGGIGSINESIAAGVPMVVYPFRFLDQHGNAVRVSFRGMGEVGDRRTETAVEIYDRIDRVLSERRFSENVITMRAEFARYENELTIVREIHSLTGQPTSRETPGGQSG